MYHVIIKNLVPTLLNASPPSGYGDVDSDRMYPIKSFTLTESMVETDTFQFTIEGFDGAIEQNNRVEVYAGNPGRQIGDDFTALNHQSYFEPVVVGIIIDYTPGENSMTFSCVGMLYELSRYSAVPNITLANQQFLGSVAYLLRWMLENTQTFSTPIPSLSGGAVTNYFPFDVPYPSQDMNLALTTWDLGDISTLREPREVSTIDLGGEERKLAQIKTLINTELSVYIRYGGFDSVNNKHLLDMGTFDVDSGATFTRFSITAQVNNELPLKGMIVFGGTFTGAGGNPNIIKMTHAAARILAKPNKRKFNPYTNETFEIFNPTTVSNEQPAFIYTTVGGLGNDQIIPGQIVYKRYDECVPTTKNNPTSLQREQAGFQAYKKGCSEMLKHNVSIITWNVTIDEDFPSTIKPGMKIRLTKNIHKGETDPITLTTIWRKNQTLSVDQDFWIQSQTLTYQEDGTIRANLTLLELPEYDTRSFDAAVMRMTRKKPKSDNTDDFSFLATVPRFGYYEHTFPLATPAGGSGGAEHTFTKIPGTPEDVFGDLTSFPNNLTAITAYRAYVDDPNGVVTFLAVPTAGVATFSISVKINGTWTASDTCTVKVFVEFV